MWPDGSDRSQAREEEMAGRGREIDRTQDGTFLKVRFPIYGHKTLRTEWMWVRLTIGDENDGAGVLMNTPSYFSQAIAGEVVRYVGGTATQTPRWLPDVEGPEH